MQYDFSTGFQTSQGEIIALIVFGVAIVAIFIVAALRMPKHPRRRTSEPLRFRYVESEQPAKLTREEELLLERLGWYAKNDSVRERLRKDDKVFARCASCAVRDGVSKESEVLDLAKRLGRDVGPIRGSVLTTRNIPVGSQFTASSPTAVIEGRVVDVEGDSILVKLNKRSRKLPADTSLEIICVGPVGVLHFVTAVAKHRGKRLELRHAVQIERTQRRVYRRRSVKVPLRVELPGLDQPPLETTTVDISVGGMAIRNPKKALFVGQTVRCSFMGVPDKPPVVVQGMILRTSNRNRLAHLRYLHLDGNTKFQLYQFLFQTGVHTDGR